MSIALSYDKAFDFSRGLFTEFLSWLDGGGFRGTPYKFPEDKSVWLPSIREAFPEFSQRMDEVLSQHEAKKNFREKFNGKILGSWTGLEWRQLGQAMACLRRELGESGQMAVLFDKLGQDGFKQKVLLCLDREFGVSSPRPCMR